MKSFFLKKIPLYYFFLVVSLAGLYVIKFSKPESLKVNPALITNVNAHIGGTNSMNLIRSEDFIYTRPLIIDEIPEQASSLQKLKAGLNEIISGYVSSGYASSVSVHLRNLNDGSWMSINETESFIPASMLKMAVLITYLKQAEKTPSILDVKLSSDREDVVPQTFTDKTIEKGKRYPIRQLLEYMIEYSDNRANMLLYDNMDQASFRKVFGDLHIALSDNPDFSTTAGAISRFMLVLYNATYLNPKNSDYALSLLSRTSFKEGLVKGIPAGTKIVHKFGEKILDNENQLHESGIIYKNQSPYLLTVMSKGRDVKKLPEILSRISKEVFENFN